MCLRERVGFQGTKAWPICALKDAPSSGATGKDVQGLFKGHLGRPDIIIIKRADHRGTKGGQTGILALEDGRPFRPV